LARGVSNVETGRLLGVTEGTVRYHRARQVPIAAAYRQAIDVYLAAEGEAHAMWWRCMHTWSPSTTILGACARAALCA
jgi:hypothetical protein